MYQMNYHIFHTLTLVCQNLTHEDKPSHTNVNTPSLIAFSNVRVGFLKNMLPLFYN